MDHASVYVTCPDEATARRILTDHRGDLDKIAQALLEYETLMFADTPGEALARLPSISAP